MRCPRRLPSQPLYTRLGLGESALGYRDGFLTLALPCTPSRAFHVGRGLLRRCFRWASRGPIGAPCRPAGCIRASILTRRSRGVTPSSVAPECLGDSKSRAGTRISHCFIIVGTTWLQVADSFEP